MIKAIFTNIKDEHRYLEEWLEYHIRLGINKFILYEDEGSISHADIIEKYNKVTSIDFYDYVLKKDSEEFKDFTCFRHVCDNYNNIDWLIKLDPDEYRVMPEDNTIDDLLYNVDEKYDQITLFWKIYNANGFIEEPYHGKYSLMDTYVDSIDINNLATYFTSNTSINNYTIGKSFIRYKRVLDNGFEVCNGFPHWILPITETTMDGDSINVYINHYMTKSFQEFYERLSKKGEYSKEFHRKLGDFFVLNPDMIDKIPEIESKFNVDIFSFETKVN